MKIRAQWLPSVLVAALFAVVLSGPAPARAQAPTETRLAEPGEIQELRLADGSTLIGRVIRAGDPIRFELSSGGVIDVSVAQVRGLRAVEGELHDGELWRPDPSSNRLFFGPTARMVGAGHGYLAVFEAFFPSVSVGLTDRATIGAGTLLIGDVGDERPFWLVPKLQVVAQERAQVALGALAIVSGDNTAGILYGVATLGEPDQAVTLGVGYGWVNDQLADIPAFLLGGETRVAKGVKLITENYLIPTGEGEHQVLLSAGPRFFGERLTADLGIAIAPTDGGGFFPLVNFVYNW